MKEIQIIQKHSKFLISLDKPENKEELESYYQNWYFLLKLI